jgi:hypothetical protein
MNFKEFMEGAGDVQYSSDYKLAASGRKVKARRLEFKNGEDDREKNVRSEQAPVAPSLGVHRVAVTTSEPDHPMVSKRKETTQRFVKVTTNSKERAIEQGMKHFKRKGFKVHSAEHVSMVHEEVEIEESIDKEHPIVKEYDSLKKNHDIKSLRGLIKGQHRIVDTSEYKTKDHAISAYLRSKHGDSKVDKAFGFNKEEAEQLKEYEIHHDGNGNYRDDEGNEWNSKSKNAPRGNFARKHTITSDVPHAVHINGKKWKTFGSQSHATNVAKKISGATVHKEEAEIDEATTGATKLVHTRTGKDGAKYHIMQDSPSDFSIHREHNGKTKHIDTYGSLHRAKSVLDNEVKEEVEIEEKLNPSMGAGEYIKDFQKSDAPQFKGKSKEKKRMMGIAAYMAAKKSMKEEAELEEAESHQSKTTMKHIPNASAALKKAAKDIKPGVAGYRDRIAMLKAGGVKEEVEQLDEKIYADEYHATSEKSQFGGHRPHVINKETGHTMFLGQHAYKKPEHAIGHAQAYLNAYAKGGMHQADNHSAAYVKANKHNLHEELKGDQHKIDKNKNGKVDAEDFKKLRKEESIDEARINGREYASHGLMHPDHAKMDIHKVSGQHVDFYASKTGDKMQGKVTKNDGKSVHIQAHKELGDGKLHKFKVTPHLPKQQNEGNDMVTYKDFIAQLNEYETDKNGKYVHKGSYGSSYQGDDDEDEDKPKKPAGEKRGRGRPAGSGSGARQKGSGSGKSYGGIATHSLNLPSSK